ncbi:uncharacterized protein LOC132045408 [Lycium ferocissimum]|uniref:uncharacterized protein LOC132045408 n=1 Tax=Lycium ferocissimum TaxID=112874 RepID=UPI00281590F2|nr:uncharacterized protein LOC132045408 [Lycium ferocissimum]
MVRLDISEPGKVLACVEAQSSLLEQIRSRQFDNAKLCKIQDKVLQGKTKEKILDDEGLPRPLGKFNAIWVTLDRLTKSAHFIPVQTTYNLEKLAKIYIKEIVCLHGFLSLTEFAYNNSYHLSIEIAPFEALYDMRCRSFIGWFDAFEVRPWGTNLLRDSLDKVKLIQERLLTAQSRPKSYTD